LHEHALVVQTWNCILRFRIFRISGKNIKIKLCSSDKELKTWNFAWTCFSSWNLIFEIWNLEFFEIYSRFIWFFFIFLKIVKNLSKSVWVEAGELKFCINVLYHWIFLSMIIRFWSFGWIFQENSYFTSLLHPKKSKKSSGVHNWYLRWFFWRIHLRQVI
jgi:hypothetical protein